MYSSVWNILVSATGNPRMAVEFSEDEKALLRLAVALAYFMSSIKSF